MVESHNQMFGRRHRNQVADWEIADFHRQLKECGREAQAYPPLPDRTPEEYAEDVRGGGPWWLITWDGESIGSFYLTGLEGGCAQCHFSFLAGHPAFYRGRPFLEAAGRWILASTLHDTGTDGAFLIDTLIGSTPEENRGAVSLIKSLGGKIVGTIPGAAWLKRERRNGGAVISYFNRALVPHNWIRKYGQRPILA